MNLEETCKSPLWQSRMGSPRSQLPVLLIICVLHPMLLPVSHGCSAEKRAALMKVRSSLVQANSTATPLVWGKRFTGHDDCCLWERVWCSNTTHRVSDLDLSSVYSAPDPARSLPWSLSELQFLDLSDNNLTLLSFEGFKNLRNLQELNLFCNKITGNLPSFLFSLPHIEILDVSLNMLQGCIPINSSLNLSLSLRKLYLSENNLNGRFSFFWLKNLKNLTEIDLSWNANLSINVNNTIGWMPQFQLKRIYLSSCDIDKDIIANPRFLGTQYRLEYLDLSNNNLPGGMPSWLFRKVSTLTDLNLRNNSLTGSLGPINYPQTSLQSIDISMNHIVGQLPANISSLFPSLDKLDVSKNQLSGEIPTSLCHIDRLVTIDLSDNKFSSEMPACLFTDLFKLEFLMASNNNLSGPIFGGRSNLSIGVAMLLDGNKFDGELPRNLSGGLEQMDLHDNKLTGEVYASSWNLSSLSLLDVADNYMSGEIFPQICDLPSIAFLDLSNNYFIGRIRTCNGLFLLSLNASMNMLSGDVTWNHFNTSNIFDINSSIIFNLDIRHNMLVGNLNWVNNLPWMGALSLGHNKFHGQIPPGLCELRFLRIIDLSHNNLSGPVPPCFGAISFQDTSEYNNPIYGFDNNIKSWDPEGGFTFITKGMQLTYNPSNTLMYGIDLSGNSLAGEIPCQLGELSHLKSLNLSHNALVGSIPASLANMSEVESLDLSYNKLTGAIPSELTQLRSLEVFYVAYNKLSGCVPSSSQFDTFGADSYEGNIQLKIDCSSSRSGSNELGPFSPSSNKMVVDTATYAVIAASFVLAFWFTVAFTFYHPMGRRMVLKL